MEKHPKSEFLENILQAKLSDIGYHKDMGTHNRVIRISERVYLELIAIDPKINNPTMGSPAFFIDVIFTFNNK